MKIPYEKSLVFLFTIVFVLHLFGENKHFSSSDKNSQSSSIIIEEAIDDYTIKEGLVSQSDDIIQVIREDSIAAVITLSKPEIVAQANKEEKWGFFQFPILGKADDGTLVVGWSMRADSHKAYGELPQKSESPLISKDRGKTWEIKDKNYFAVGGSYHVYLDDNHILEINTPKSRDVNTYEMFPNPITRIGNRSFFNMNNLPNDLQGVYLNDYKKGQKAEFIHAKLHDPGLLRYSIDGLMPICWWGNIKKLKDKSLVAGIYPTYYQDKRGNVLPGGITFYRSEDDGRTWSVIGKIPYIDDELGKKRVYKSYDEPTFEVLKDSTFICVMRTGATDPMYKTYSYDFCKTWTTPEAFTPNGVKPSLLLLKNGVLVLVSGRPGVQIRFSLDGRGNTWTQPIEMMPFMKRKGDFDIYASCGYAAIIESGENSFYIVYSDFKQKNDNGDERKTIMFREVSITNK